MPKQRPYAHTRESIADATNTDLVRLVIIAARTSWRYLQPLPPFIKRDNAPEYAYHIAKAIEYRYEDGDQLIRMPWRTVEDGHGDCKSLSVLTAAICRAAGCDTVLRFVIYPGDTHYAHVYTVADGIVIDPELSFGDEVPHARRYDVGV